MKKTDEQKQLIRDNKMIPLFWKVVTDKEKHMLIVTKSKKAASRCARPEGGMEI